MELSEIFDMWDENNFPLIIIYKCKDCDMWHIQGVIELDEEHPYRSAEAAAQDLFLTLDDQN